MNTVQTEKTQMELGFEGLKEIEESKWIVGFDEAGRGPLAGPVSAGCVILPKDFPLDLLNDSKKLTPKKRAKALEVIKEKALWGLGLVDHEEIDRINILNASLKAMSLAWKDMISKMDSWCQKNGIPIIELEEMLGIADGIYVPEVECKCISVVKADGKYAQVMAASIVAKEERDRIMVEYDSLYPQYGYKEHKGYPTKDHKEACRKYGPSPIQRKSFKY